MRTGDVITFVSHTNKPGGGELALRRYLEATALPVRLVTLEPGGVWDGISVEVVSVRGLLGLRKSLLDGGLVVANSMRAAFYCALVLPRRGKLVYWVRDGLTDSAMSSFALALTRQVTARRTSHYLANSEWTAGTIRDALNVDRTGVNVLYSMCGVTEDMLHGPTRTDPHEPLRLLYLGRISRWKAPDIAVRALAPLRELGVEATLTIAGGAHFGEDAYASELRELVDEESTASMVGHVDDVQGLLRSHDILVHCSTVPEPFGQVIVQALAAGIPVIATDRGGPVEILRREPPTLLYPANEPRRLAEAIDEILEEYQAVCSWALDRSSSFADSKLTSKADSVLRLLSSH